MSGAAGRKRAVDPISMSFLDVISCGFGAVILLFMLMHHAPDPLPPVTDQANAEVALLDQDIQSGQNALVRVRNTISDVDQQLVEAQGLARRIEEELNTRREELASVEDSTLTEQEVIARLQADIQSLEEEVERLRAAASDAGGNDIRAFMGDGNRQYLTGLILGGSRILILVDVSGSMLDATIVNIIRRRNMPVDQQLNARKWVQVRRTVDWLTARLPPPSQYQIYTFNNQTRALLPGTDGRWLEVADEPQLQNAVDLLAQTVPSEGTNLETLFTAVKLLDPLPDNIYLITDGLPTLGSRGSNAGTVTGRQREELFDRAVRELPAGIPVNVIMAPLEGDPMAPALYWQLALRTGGSFMIPSDDWP
ncbi:MAG TPA: hypothetical protein VNR18_14105 [Hyphomicrobiales bacterium]|nr:hypothetical protein [Hyphomicrobiales bacterium]